MEAYDLNDGGAIQREYEKMDKELSKLVIEAYAKGVGMNPLAVLTATRQAVELLKVPGLVQMTNELLEEGNSVIIFTNYVATLELLCDRLNTKSAIYGQTSTGHDQTIEERTNVIANFQSDRERVVISNIGAGGLGISLHDLHGDYPRVSLICPTYNAKQLRQVFGRPHRAGGKSVVVQRVIFAAGTVEETICHRVRGKLHNLDLLNDGDLNVTNVLSPGQSFSKKPGCASVRKTDVDKRGPVGEPQGTTNQEALSMTNTIEERTESPALKHESRKHSPYSPSALKALSVCSGYKVDPDADTKFADRGSLGHECVENETPERITDDPFLKQAVNWCLSYRSHLLRNLSKRGTYTIYKETDLPYFDQWGFADLVILSNEGKDADLVDWKFTNPLHAADGPQFYAYCLGIWNRWPSVDQITVRVVHPFRSQIDVEHFNRQEHLGAFETKVLALIKRGERNDPEEYQPSSQCAYCGRAGKCKALARVGVEVGLRYERTFLKIPEDGSLHGSEVDDPVTMALLLKLAPVLEKAARGWKKAGVEMWISGTEVPGYELAHTAGRRVIDSARATYEIVKDRVHLDQFLDCCSVSVPELEDLYAATAKRGDKGKSKQQLMAKLEDENLLSSGAGSDHLRPVRE